MPSCYADEAVEGLKLLQDALKGLPSDVADGILKNPALMEQLAKNPGLLEEAIRRGEEGVQELVKGGEEGLRRLHETRLAPDEITSKGENLFDDDEEEIVNIFISYDESRNWFTSQYTEDDPETILGRMPGLGYGLKVNFRGASSKFIEPTIKELDFLARNYPEVAEGIHSILVRNTGAIYPNGDVFNGFASAVPNYETGLIEEIWLNEDTYRRGYLSKYEAIIHNGTCLSFPGEGKINFQSLTDHEFGHALT